MGAEATAEMPPWVMQACRDSTEIDEGVQFVMNPVRFAVAPFLAFPHSGVKPMRKTTVLTFAALAAATFAAAPADARSSCFKKYSMGESLTEDTAKFQADEALLQATDWGAWASWMVGGGTPGYTFSPRKYHCSQDGGMWTCHAQATFCKL